MNFRPRKREEPEINLIPFIDVLLVVLIFLMLSTTYSKFTELQLKLPVADADAQRDYPKELLVTVSSEGNYGVNRVAVRRSRRNWPKNAASSSCASNGRTFETYWSGRTTTIAPFARSMPRRSKMSGPFFKSGQ